MALLSESVFHAPVKHDLYDAQLIINNCGRKISASVYTQLYYLYAKSLFTLRDGGHEIV
jgi:hypothetical protein